MAGSEIRHSYARITLASCVPLILCIAASTLSGALYVPSALNGVILSVSVFMAFLHRLPVMKYFFMFWNGWLLIGSVSLYAQNNLSSGLNYNIDPSSANNYFILCIIFAQLPSLLFQNASRSYDKGDELVGSYSRNNLILLFFILFPIVYALSIFIAVGEFPLFSGRNISAEMYEIDYGPVHGFGILVSCSIIGIWLRYSNSDNKTLVRSLLVYGFLMVCVVLAAADGRRVMALFSVAGILLSYFRKPRGFRMVAGALLTIALVLTAYILASTIRSGRDSQAAFEDGSVALSTIGVEYRDFVYAYKNISPAEMRAAGYDWPESTFASAMPSLVLSLFDVRKTDSIYRDSARTLMYFWNVNLGIRIGLPGELWFFSGWWSLAIFSVFGMAVYILVLAASRVRDLDYKAIIYTQLAVYLLAINGQSTVTFGLTLPLLYFATLVSVVHFLSNRDFWSR